MNCPFHILIYQSRQRVYRELPLRLFELGTVYRYERSGVRARPDRGCAGFTQDDAHIFCTPEQLADELDVAARRSCSTLLRDVRPRGLRGRAVDPARRSPSASRRGVGRGHRGAARRRSRRRASTYVVDEGEGAFYGPKIDVQVRDAIGRRWQLSTIQVDFQLPQRFDLEYVGADNQRHRPVMIHRALFGSVERFFGILLEHYAGAFPAWLAPVQVRVLPVRDDHEAYAVAVVDRLKADGLPGRHGRGRRAARRPHPQGQAGEAPLRARRRRRRRRRTARSGVNPRGGEVERGVPVDDFVDRLRAEVADRHVR